MKSSSKETTKTKKKTELKQGSEEWKKNPNHAN